MKEYESNFNEENIDAVILNEEVVVTLSAQCKENDASCDVSILTLKEEKFFSNLAWIESKLSNSQKVKFSPKLHYIIGNIDNPFLAVLGLSKIVFINCKNNSIFEAVQLNRKKNEDQGFYFFKVLFLKEDFLVIYESGVCRLTVTGIVLWHKNLMWDDIYLDSDENYMYYSSEFGDPVDWVLSIRTGEKISLNQLSNS